MRTVDAQGPALLATVIADCVVRSDVAQWQHSWARGPAVLIRPSGAELDVKEIARRLADPRTAAAARDELAALGVKVDFTITVPQPRVSAPRVLGLIANVVVDGDRRDLIIYNQGLAVLPSSRRAQMYAWESHLRTVADQRLEEIKLAPGHRYLPFDEVAGCVRTKPSVLGRAMTLLGGLRFASGGAAFAVELTMRDGVKIRIRWGLETSFTDGSAAVLQRCVDMLTAV